MLNILRKDYGEYVKGFFQISLDMELEDYLSINRMKPEELATLVHEYVHFLQNITTTYGVGYFNDNSSFIQLFISDADKYEKNIPFPFLEENSGVENAYEEAELRSFYLGDSMQKKIHHINAIKIESDEIMNSIIQNEKLELVNIYYNDESIPYAFGASCIEESMAYLIESEKFSGLCRKNEFPYNSCELVCENLCPELVEKKNIIVALAEISLMHFNCGLKFVELVKTIGRKRIELRNTHEVVKIFKDDISFEIYRKVYEESFEKIDFLYPINTPFKNINIWLKDKFKKGFEYRRKFCNLLAQMMDMPRKKSRDYFVTLTNEFEFPALCDRNNNIFSSIDDMSLALVPIAIFNTFKGMGTECYLYKYCKVSKIPTINENCKQAPWLQSEKDILCPYGLFWYHYGLSGKIVNKTRRIKN